MEKHRDTCNVNHTGSASEIEVDAMKEMFFRSQELFCILLGVKYINYIGETKTFKGLLDLNLYHDIVVQKKEYIGLV